ncbi:unnamed protein product [Sympodiomycopsis kandeliae]
MGPHGRLACIPTRPEANSIFHWSAATVKVQHIKRTTPPYRRSRIVYKMKTVSQRIERDGSGKVTLIPEEDEDMYHLLNLIEEGDIVKASAVRRVQSESTTGTIESHRVKTTLSIQVTKINFDSTGSNAPIDPGSENGAKSSDPSTSTQGALGGGSAGSQGPGATLQVSGRVVEENQHVKMGAFHTLDLEINRQLSITKQSWDSIHLERLSESNDVSNRAEVGAVVLGEGTAIVCLLTEHMTVIRQRIEVPLPRKRKGLPASAGDKNLAKFHVQVYNAVLKLLSLPALRLVILASPGFIKETIYDFLFSEAIKRNDKQLIGNDVKRKFLKIHCSSPHLHSLMEVLQSPEISTQLKDTKFAKEGQLLDEFMKMLSSDEQRAWYSENHVLLAADRGAISKLLISDGLFRSPDPNRRKKFVQLVQDVRSQGGQVAIFSSMHESGRQLNGLTGIAAILTWPMDVEQVEEEEQEALQKQESQQQNTDGEAPLPAPNTNLQTQS